MEQSIQPQKATQITYNSKMLVGTKTPGISDLKKLTTNFTEKSTSGKAHDDQEIFYVNHAITRMQKPKEGSLYST